MTKGEGQQVIDSEKCIRRLTRWMACAVVGIAISTPTRADETNWINPGTGDWFDILNWDNGLPGVSDYARIDNAGTSVVTGIDAEVFVLTIGEHLSGNLQVLSGGVLSGGGGYLAVGPDSSAAAIVTGSGALWTNRGSLIVGEIGDGELSISEGGVVITNTGPAAPVANVLGQQAHSDGRLSVTGTGSEFRANGPLTVGEYGTGELTIREGGKVYNTVGSIGMYEGSVSKAHVSGTESLWSNTDLRIGYDGGAGELLIDNGAAVIGFNATVRGENSSAVVRGEETTWSAGALSLQASSIRIEESGLLLSSSGALSLGASATVSGDNSRWQNQGEISVGASNGHGTVLVEHRGLVSAAFTTLGQASGAAGYIKVTGEGSAWTSDLMHVGRNGYGSLHIEQNGRVYGHNALIGAQSSGNGLVVVEGPGARWLLTGDMEVGARGTGELRIINGGEVTSDIGRIGSFSPSDGSVLVTGEGSTWTNSNKLYVGGGGFFNDTGGKGVLTISDQGLVISRGGSIAAFPSSGVATITGNGSRWINTDNLGMGGTTFTTGQMSILDGGFVSNVDASISVAMGSENSIHVHGPGSTWTNSGQLLLGERGAASLSVTEGGFVSTASTVAGVWDTSSATAWVSGQDALWANDTFLVWGLQGPSHMTIAQGGTVTSNTLAAAPQGSILVDIDGTLSVANGITISGQLVNHGTVSGGLTVEWGGIVSGTGLFDGTVTIGEGGSFSPGASPGTGNTSDTVWGAGGSYLWEINALASMGGVEGSDPGWDLWNTGELTILGPFSIALSTLGLDNEPGLLDGWDPLLAQQWRIATAEVPAFASLELLSVDASGFQNSLAGGSFWLAGSHDGRELFLHFTPVPEPSSLLIALLGLAGVGLYGRRCSAR